MQNEFKAEFTLSVKQYQAIAANAAIRIEKWKTIDNEGFKKFLITREEGIIRYCNGMIELIQSQLN